MGSGFIAQERPSSFRIRFQVSIVTAILLIIAAMTTATLGSVYLASTRTAHEAAEHLFEQAAQGAQARIDRQVGLTMALANLGAVQAGMTGVSGSGLEAPALPFMFAALEQEAPLYSLYYGFADGSFLQVIATRGDSRILGAHQAPAEAQWIVRAITGAGDRRQQVWSFLDGARKTIEQRVEARPAYDPRLRPWYAAAVTEDGPQLSAAYVFNSLKAPGITASRRLPQGRGAFGADITLANLDAFVAEQTISANGGMVLFDESRRILAISPSLTAEPVPQLADLRTVDSPMTQALDSIGTESTGGALKSVDWQGQRLLTHIAHWRGSAGRGVSIAIIAPADDFTAHIRTLRSQILLLALSELCLFVDGVADHVAVVGLSRG
ncbi:MAG TPA: cache domain-containing protein, partial [Magnetospirillum sp.]|nr:cache domain-containing protein [Magnetospirillum sp.]